MAEQIDDILASPTHLLARNDANGATGPNSVGSLTPAAARTLLGVATSAQGALADTALQPTDIASGAITARTGAIDLSGGTDGDVLTVQADGSLAVETPAGGGFALPYAGSHTVSGTASTATFDLTPTWNTTGTPTVIDVDVTDTASNAASLLMNLQVGGVSQVSVTKGGLLEANQFVPPSGPDTASTPKYLFRSDLSNYGIGYSGGPCIYHTGINSFCQRTTTSTQVASNGAWAFSSSTLASGTADTAITRVEAGSVKIGTAIGAGERSSDPADPAEGAWVQWMSDGTGSGDDGDIMVKITAGGVTKTITLIDFSAS